MSGSHIKGTTLSGKELAATIRGEIKAEVSALKESESISPSVAVVLVGGRPDSATYVRMKKRACEEVGIEFTLLTFPEDVTQEELLNEVQKVNEDPSVHGLLVQLPLPDHIDTKIVLDKVDPSKDVDGCHPVHMGSLAMRGHSPLFIPCTPKGCLELLVRSGVEVEGKHAVVIGRSNLVGIPAAFLLLEANATVTICHSRTANIEEEVRRADIVVAAVGKAEMVKGSWIKPGAVCLDVGINAVDDDTRKRGYRLVGDIEFSTASENASLITPVPGGVGPMTVAMLLKNTLLSAQRAANKA
eukprot:TRINITY_DN434_c0_g1_i1.p1 TRINITY_DN434_c0_g1~~TRINITY_DN434_c0_g1_i1.p1  ORF type:complete len:320 (+),score=53.25 TRINITY_DN434_c0_g1_i1:62-961(+)